MNDKRKTNSIDVGYQLLNGNLIISEGIETIDTDAFSYNKDIKSIVFPSTLKTIKERAFGVCRKLEKIDLSKTNNVNIEKNAFVNCGNLKDIIFPNSIKTIYPQAFFDCHSLEKIDLSNTKSIETIRNSAFDGCLNIKGIKISKDNPIYSDMGCNIIYNKIDNEIIQGCDTSIIPSRTKTIGSKAFAFHNLNDLIIPESVELIDYAAFDNCNIKNLTLNTGLKRIIQKAFKDTNIESVCIPATVEIIDEDAFGNCQNLKEVFLLGDTKIDTYAFYRCFNLENVYYLKDKPRCSELIIYKDRYIKPEFLSLNTLIENGKTFNEANKILKTTKDIER